MSDYIVRATAADNQIRAFAATTKELVEHARSVHNTSPVATAALGRLLTAGSMMGAMMKGEKDILTLQIKCSGPIGGLTVTADSKARVKGYVNNPEVMLPPNSKGKLDVGGALDLGILSVIKDMGLKEPYVGQTQLVSGEIAEDLTYYFASSEQVPSSVALGVLMNKERVIAGLEKKIAEIHSITELLDKEMSPEAILDYILGDFGLEIMDTVETSFYCNCTKKRVEKAIVSIGRKDIQEMIDDNEPIEVNCHFCNTSYHFSVEELKEILKRSH
ncbi:MAG: Hsp33 family molecular chaperone HslO [Acetivibrio ethanolgignens]